MGEMTGNEGHALTGAPVRATLRHRTGLALHQLLAAGRCASRVAILESENAGQPLGSFWDEILHNSLGVVTMGVASLECYANELWFEQTVVRSILNEVAASQIAELIDKESVLTKYSLALALHTGKRLDFGSAPVQGADALIKLRNAVVHFRPEWFDTQAKHEKLSSLLEGKFQPSQFFPKEPMFPRAWATGDFSAWAIRSTVTFLDHFYTEAGVDNPLEKFKPRLMEISGIAL